jgi:hypothetical protein
MRHHDGVEREWHVEPQRSKHEPEARPTCSYVLVIGRGGGAAAERDHAAPLCGSRESIGTSPTFEIVLRLLK